MKHPYICLVSGDEVTALITHHNFGIIIDDPKKVLEETSKVEYGNTYTENNDGSLRGHVKNITTEYLANTYGEVKSKGHAEFIVKLAELNGVAVSGCANVENAKWFSFRAQSGIPRLALLSNKDSICNIECRKQITIPLPPEREFEETKNLGNGLKLTTFKTDLLNDEWPKVGDEVLFKPNPSQPNKIKAEIKYIGDKFTILKSESGREFSRRNSKLLIEKPKTPEQELRESVSGLILAKHRELLGCDDVTPTTLIRMADDCAEILTKTHNITKKPQ